MHKPPDEPADPDELTPDDTPPDDNDEDETVVPPDA